MKRMHFAAVAALVIAIGCGGAVALGSERDSKPAAPAVIIADTDQLLPSATLTDWRSFSDHLVMVRVLGEQKLEPSAEEIAAGEGYIPRAITLSVESVLWSRDGAPAAPVEFTTDLDGWSFKGDELTPIRLEGEPMMSVGKDYVMPIVYLAQSDKVITPGWSPLAPDAISPYESGVLSDNDPLIAHDAQGAGQAVPRSDYFGKAPGVLASALQNHAAYPQLAGKDSLPLDERMELVDGR